MPYATLPTDSDTRSSQTAPTWRGPSANGRYPIWLGVGGAVLIVGMLLAFLQVVSGAVQQGEARRGATAAQLAATAHCTAMQGRSAQEACRVQVAADGARP